MNKTVAHVGISIISIKHLIHFYTIEVPKLTRGPGFRFWSPGSPGPPYCRPSRYGCTPQRHRWSTSPKGKWFISFFFQHFPLSLSYLFPIDLLFISLFRSFSCKCMVTRTFWKDCKMPQSLSFWLSVLTSGLTRKKKFNMTKTT